MNRRDLLRLSVPAAIAASLVPAAVNAQSISLTSAESKQFVDTLLNPKDVPITLSDAAVWYTRGLWRNSHLLDSVLSELSSNEFVCGLGNWMGEAGRYKDVSSNETFDTGQKGTYDENGRCTSVITATLIPEWGEFGTRLSSDLRLTGPCAEYHWYNDDSHTYRNMVTRYEERKQLLKKVKSILNESVKA